MSGEIILGVGSIKGFKVELARAFLTREFSTERISVLGRETDSGVSPMPISLEETIQGACNRSRSALAVGVATHFGIGLEGGVCLKKRVFHLIEAAAITLKRGESVLYTESGISDLVRLPEVFTDGLLEGKLLGDLIQQFLLSRGITASMEEIQKNGSAYYFSKSRISRYQMMNQALARAMKKMDDELKGESKVRRGRFSFLAG